MDKKRKMTTNKSSILFIMFVFLLATSCKETKQNFIYNANENELAENEINDFFNELVDSLNVSGFSVAVINDARIVYHQVFGLMRKGSKEVINKETYFEAASLSKPLFAFFVMKQVDKGLLELDKPLYEYLPYLDIEYDKRYEQITARMILSHTSGLPNWRNDSLKIEFTPGTKYQYSGEGYRYLSKVLASINEIPFGSLDSLFQEEIVKPLGASKLYFQWNEEIPKNKATGHLNNEPTDNLEVRKDLYFGAAGGLHTEASNYAKFLIAIMNREILSSESYDEMLTTQIELPKDDINSIIMNASGWSLGFGMIPTSSEICYWHSGNNQDFQSWFHFYPKRKYGIVVFSNSDKIQSPEFFTKFFDFLEDGIEFDMSKLER